MRRYTYLYKQEMYRENFIFRDSPSLLCASTCHPSVHQPFYFQGFSSPKVRRRCRSTFSHYRFILISNFTLFKVAYVILRPFNTSREIVAILRSQMRYYFRSRNQVSIYGVPCVSYHILLANFLIRLCAIGLFVQLKRNLTAKLVNALAHSTAIWEISCIK